MTCIPLQLEYYAAGLRGFNEFMEYEFMESYCLVHNLFKLESMIGDAHRAAHVDFSVDFEAFICNLLNFSFLYIAVMKKLTHWV